MNQADFIAGSKENPKNRHISRLEILKWFLCGVRENLCRIWHRYYLPRNLLIVN